MHEIQNEQWINKQPQKCWNKEQRTRGKQINLNQSKMLKTRSPEPNSTYNRRWIARTAVDIALDSDSNERLKATFEKYGCLAAGGSFKEYEESKGTRKDNHEKRRPKGKGKGKDSRARPKEASRHMQLKKFQKNWGLAPLRSWWSFRRLRATELEQVESFGLVLSWYSASLGEENYTQRPYNTYNINTHTCTRLLTQLPWS